MPRYIDATNAINLLSLFYNYTDAERFELALAISAVPTANVVERKRGKWIYDMNGYYKCSCCGISTFIPDNGSAFVDDSESYHFCRWCGVEMREETEDEEK